MSVREDNRGAAKVENFLLESDEEMANEWK
jgi:hypothetical protein